jgi:predicted amidohydrolase YtcJ
MLSGDIMTMPPQGILRVQVKLTVVGGEIVFSQ